MFLKCGGLLGTSKLSFGGNTHEQPSTVIDDEYSETNIAQSSAVASVIMQPARDPATNITTNAQSCWRLEAENPCLGDVSATSAGYRLRHESEHKYLGFSADRGLLLTLDTAKCALFELVPVHDNSSWLLDGAYYQLKYHMAAKGEKRVAPLGSHVCSNLCGEVAAARRVCVLFPAHCPPLHKN
jgi:hypothetical protein